MKKNKIIYFIYVSIILSYFTSCDGDCKEKEIERIDWVTKYKKYFKDTLVQYSIVNQSTQYIGDLGEVMHCVTIKNQNNYFSNKFALDITFGYYDKYNGSEDRFYLSDYIEILPDSTYTFTYYHQAKYEYNFNCSIKVLQLPKRIQITKRFDILRTEIISVNSCEQNIEALENKYQTIKELYSSKMVADSLN